MKHFTLGEFEKSETAWARGIDNTIPYDAEVNIRKLVENILDPAREKFGEPIIITSGYRCSKLNKVLERVYGASPTSLHVFGMAADITAKDYHDNVKLLEILKRLPCYELIVYRYRSDPELINRFHVAYKANAEPKVTFSKFI
jgi:zinc D-Ala-D-Ala carboxypeptidase